MVRQGQGVLNYLCGVEVNPASSNALTTVAFGLGRDRSQARVKDRVELRHAVVRMVLTRAVGSACVPGCKALRHAIGGRRSEGKGRGGTAERRGEVNRLYAKAPR